MNAARTLPRNEDPAPAETPDAAVAAASSLRRCLVTGEMLPKDELIRFVIGPDQTLVPDLAQNLPGRGLWVKAERAALDEAARKNPFAKAAKAQVKIPADLARQVAALLRRRCLDFLGLAKRAGVLVLGQKQVEAALKAGKLDLLLLAEDAADDLSRISALHLFGREEMGRALGYGQNVYVGLLRHALTGKLRLEITRLEKIAPEAHIGRITQTENA
jgi:uncharacterized protein